MYVISRKVGEAIALKTRDGHPVTVRVLKVLEGKVRLGIEVDRKVRILRSELLKREQRHA
jgi:carbon storage regulator CsrA